MTEDVTIAVMPEDEVAFLDFASVVVLDSADFAILTDDFCELEVKLVVDVAFALFTLPLTVRLVATYVVLEDQVI